MVVQLRGCEVKSYVFPTVGVAPFSGFEVKSYDFPTYGVAPFSGFCKYIYIYIYIYIVFFLKKNQCDG